jgi:hypothetical protein
VSKRGGIISGKLIKRREDIMEKIIKHEGDEITAGQ